MIGIAQLKMASDPHIFWAENPHKDYSRFMQEVLVSHVRSIVIAKKRFYKRPSVITATAVFLMATLIVPTALMFTAPAATEPVSKPQPETMDSLMFFS